MNPSTTCLRLALLAGLLSAGCDRPAEPQPVTEEPRPVVKVLWIGNSYTASRDVPGTVDAMTAAGPSPVTTASHKSCSGGKDWLWHWENAESRARAMVAEGDYDFVVLQNHSTGSIHKAEEMADYAARFVGAIREAGAVPVFYCTWPRREDKVFTGSVESDWETIRTAYEGLAREHDALLAPVGHAWVAALGERPDLGLYEPDGSHPSALGAYLAACVFYATLGGASPTAQAQGDAWHVEFPDGEWIRGDVTIDSETAAFLQQIAAGVIR